MNHSKTIIISLKPKWATAIADLTKNHEFRSRIPTKEIDTILVYVTLPVAELRYILKVGTPIKHPIKIELGGFGNDIFNEGSKKGKYAYPILSVQKIEPISLVVLKKDFDFVAPQGFTYLEKYPKLKNYLYAEK